MIKHLESPINFDQSDDESVLSHNDTQADFQGSESPDSHGESICNSSCCSGAEISQPTDSSLLKKSGKIFGNGKNARKRCFNAIWYKTFPWLHLCCTSLKVYCFYCRTACKAHVAVMSTRADAAFTTCGFSNWKNAISKFKEHEQCLAHRDSVIAYEASKQAPINAQLTRELNNIQCQRRKSLLNQIISLRYLL